jgi:hypothetical protein
MATITLERPSSIPWIRVAVCCVLVALVAAVAALYAQNANLASRVTRLQSSTGTQAELSTQVSRQSSAIDKLTADEGRITAANTALTSQVAALSDLTSPKSFASQLHVIFNCVPQMETQVNSITLGGAGAYQWITNSAQVSGDCSKFIYGNTP